MKKIIVLLTFCFFISCLSTTKKYSMEPYKAKIPELRFDYLKEGIWMPVFGHGADYFIAGELKQFKIKMNKNSGNCQIRVIDGDNDSVYDCSKKGELIVDLGKYGQSAKEPSVLGISVASDKLGIQQGYFYPSLDKIRNLLPVQFKCPYQNTTKNVTVCTRPANYDFNMTAEVNDNKPGELLFRYKCGNDNLIEKTTPILSAGFFDFSISSASPAYCVLFFGLRQDKQSDGSYAIVKSRIMHVRFYEETYIPLSQPTITKISSGGWEACAVETYAAFSVNGVDKSKLNFGKCIKVPDEKVEIDVWDDIGRFSWNIEPKSKDYLNNFSFYREAGIFVSQFFEKCKNDMTCVKEDIRNNSKMIEAVIKWDASILYQ